MLDIFDVRRFLQLPLVYGLHSRAAASSSKKKEFVDRFLDLRAGDRVLDIGCGPAPLLKYMPKVAYIGFDLSQEYIEEARAIYGPRGEFHHRAITADVAKDFEPFDLAMSIGVLHHLNDHEAQTLFQVAHDALKPGGRLITCDGTFLPRQNPVARLLLNMDRGKYIRAPDEYEAIARRVFTQVEKSVHHDLNSFPYSHCVLCCARS